MTIRVSVLSVLSTVVFLMISSSHLATAEDLFVDNEVGDDANDGTHQYFDAWATIQHAINNAAKGDTIYVRATGIPYAPFTVDQSKITLVGWSVEAGGHTGFDDGSALPVDYNEAASWPPKRPIADPDATLATDFVEIRNFGFNDVSGPKKGAQSWLVQQPTIDANDRENAIGITVIADEVVIRNFDITDVAWGLLGNGIHDCIFENIYVYEIGDNVNGGGAGEDGRGIHLYASHDNIITNCVVYNSAGYGISSNSGYSNNILGCRVYCDDNSTGSISATHYYFIVHDGNDHMVVGCNAERRLGVDGPPQHGGHGFTISAWTKNANQDATGNKVMDCTALDIDEAILLRGQIEDNTFQNIVSTSTGLPASPTAEGHIMLDSGPEFNHFYNIYLSGPLWALSVLAPNGQIDDDPSTAARGNEFVNCIFECENAIRLWWAYDGTPQGESPYHFVDNEFFGCTFVGNGSGAFFELDRRSSGNFLNNCIITGFDEFVGTNLSGATYDPGFALNHCCVYDADNANIPGNLWSNGNFQLDPKLQLVGSGAERFKISDSSPCIDAGMTVSIYPRYSDYGGAARQGAYDVGAWESSATGGGSSQPSALNAVETPTVSETTTPTVTTRKTRTKSQRRRAIRRRGRPTAVR